MRRRLGRAGWLPPGLPLCILGACSALVEHAPAKTCESDADCDTAAGEVCALDQQVCYPATAAIPRAHLGFDLQEPATSPTQSWNFRAEMSGCDREVLLASSGNRELRLQRATVVETVAFDLLSESWDPASDTEPPRIPGTIELSHASRFHGLDFVTRLTYPTQDETGAYLPTQTEWPHYHPADAQPAAWGNGGSLVATILPDDGGAPAYAFVVTPQAQPGADCDSDADCCAGPSCEVALPSTCLTLADGSRGCSVTGGATWGFQLVYDNACDRRLVGRAVALESDGLPGPGLLDATVAFAHAAGEAGTPPPAVGALAGPHPELYCTSDADCAEGTQVCALGAGGAPGSCALDLTGRQAHRGSIVTDAVGAFSAQLYTYCSEDTGLTLDRDFTVTLSPDSADPYPTVSYSLAQTFARGPDPDIQPDAFVEGDLCVPAWSDPALLAVSLRGAPATVWGTGDTAWTCCDASCIATAAPDAGIPAPPSSCTGASSAGNPVLRIDVPFPEPDATAWAAAGCIPVRPDAQGNAGYLRRTAACDATGACDVGTLAGRSEAGSLLYTLRVESPTGSVLGSLLRDDVTVGGGAGPSLLAVDLPRRALVHGFVRLAPEVCEAVHGQDCQATAAVVQAERLRMPGETEQSVPGPYFHGVPTFTDPASGAEGAYVLPLDPGVWLITALPQVGAAGDPAPILVLDLRDGGDRELDLELQLGVLVTVKLSGFDRRARVAPLDLGSWKDLTRPDDGAALDLGAPQTCLGSDPRVGCRIRALTSAPYLLPSQVSTVQIAARFAPEAASCPP